MEAAQDMDALAMQRLAAGEDLALNDLMDRWRDRVAAFLLRMVGDHAAASDLAQETFVRLYQSRSRYKPAVSFRSYLFSIAANLARNLRRWQARHPVTPIDDLDGSKAGLASNSLSPDEELARRETARAVRDAIQSLPQDLRETLVLFTYHELSYHEIAITAGCSLKAVETRLYRARQLLKEKLQSFAPSSLAS